MKLLEITKLENSDTHTIILVKYSTSSFFGEVIKERRAYKEKGRVFWRWLDTNETLDKVYNSIDAIISTGVHKYKV